MTFSCNTCYLWIAGDYRDCILTVWSTDKFDVICTTTTSRPMHDLKWDPHCCNEFATCGVDGAVAFWLLDETASSANAGAQEHGSGVKLNVHETQLPSHIIQRKVKVLLHVHPSSGILWRKFLILLHLFR